MKGVTAKMGTAGKLYIIGTPIGNLGDLSIRGAKTLETVDFIAAEDTRVTVKLLNHLGVKKPMVSYFEHNKKERGEEIIERILSGESCGLTTDAGMPAISDPGEDLVKLCHERGVEVESVPGPTALTTALALSGMPCGRFCFEGFLTTNKTGRKEHLAALKSEERTIVFYEAPHKLISTLSDMLSIWGDRDLALVREISKLHEEVVRTTISAALEMYSDRSPKGEFVLIIAGAAPAEGKTATLDAAVRLADGLMDSGMSLSSAAKESAAVTGFKKGDIYKLLLK